MLRGTTKVKSSLFSGGFALILVLIALACPCRAQWGDHVERVSESLVWGPYHDVEISGALAFCAMGYGLAVFDISDPAHFQSRGVFPIPGQTEGLCLEGNYAYLACGARGLQILDVTDPSAPLYVGGLPLPGYAWEVVKSGDYLFVADGLSGLRVINVSQATDPQEVASLSLGAGALDLDRDGSLLFIAAESAGLKVVDVTSPSHPMVIGSYNSSGLAQGVRKIGNLVYLADGSNGVVILDVTTPASPTLTGQWSTTGVAREVEVNGVYAYVADDVRGLITLNVSSPGFPFQVGFYNSPGLAWSLCISGQTLLLADDTEGLRSFSLTNPATPTLLDAYANPGEVLSIWVEGDYAFAARGYLKAASILNVSDPLQPQTISRVNFADAPVELRVQAGVCYCAHLTGGITMTDVSIPEQPHFMDRRNTVGESYDVAPQQPAVVMVADGPEGLVFLATPPDTAWHLQTSGWARGLLPRGDLVYVSQWNAGIAVVDVTPPTQPQMLAQYDTPGLAHHCDVVNDYIYVADDVAGLTILHNGAVAGTYPTDGAVWDVKVANNLAYLAAGSAGLIVLDVTDPATPLYAGSYQTPGIALKIFLNGQDIYVANQFCLGIYRYTGLGVIPEPPVVPGAFNLGVHPNPFNPSTVASFELRVASHVRLTVWDLSGRLVTTLVEGWRPAGVHEVTFDGSRLASGLYFVRMQAGEYAAVRKMVMMK